MIDWEEIEKNCMSLEKDCVPQNAREWDVFIRQYENCIEYYEGRGYDFTSEGMTEAERVKSVDKHMYMDRGYKKSVFECGTDLNSEEKDLFKGVDWNAVGLVFCIWTQNYIFLRGMDLSILPPCPRYVARGFDCSHNDLTILKGSPRHVGGSFYCDNNRLTSLKGAPEQIDGLLYCGDINPDKDELRRLCKPRTLKTLREYLLYA
jgi:hypothetical protein